VVTDQSKVEGVVPSSTLTYRSARGADLEALRVLMDAAISELQRPFLDERQIASSRAIMGLDTQLVEDGTYFVVEADGELAGLWRMEPSCHRSMGETSRPGAVRSCSIRQKMQHGFRAMYTHPHHTRKGRGSLDSLPLRRGRKRPRASKESSSWLPWPARCSIAPAATSPVSA
jgi:hypothetical protein